MPFHDSPEGQTHSYQPITVILTGRPISVNHYKRPSVTASGKSFMYVPTEVKNAKEFWQLTAQAQMKKQDRKLIEEGDVSMEIVYYFENKARRDIDNYLKVYLDTLSGIVYRDDKQIRCLRIEKAYDPANPRVEIIINS